MPAPALCKISILCLISFPCTIFANAQLQVKTEVYPGVELLNVIHLLSDSVETVPSAYAVKVRKRFQAFRDHPAVKKAQEISLINCDFPLRHSWCFYNFPDIRLRQPDTLGAYNKYVTTAAVHNYFFSCVDFYKKSNFWEFFISCQSDYREWISTFYRNLYDENMLAGIDSFYRLKPSNKVSFTLGPMNCNSFALAETGDINPVFNGTSTIFIAYGNLYRANDSTSPHFYSKFNSQLIWHEAGHVFLADLFRKYKTEVDAMQYMFDNNAEMKKQAGSLTWKLFLDENMTQAVASFLRIRNGLISREAEFKRLNGFNEMAKIMINIIEEQYAGKQTYPNFDPFFPVLLQQLTLRINP